MTKILAISAAGFALLFGACGASSSSLPPDQARAADATAKSDARNLVSHVEACYVDSQSYARCTDSHLPDTRLPLGKGRGKVTVANVTSTGYTIQAVSKTGNTFTIGRQSDGALERTCHAVQKDAGCTGGSW